MVALRLQIRSAGDLSLRWGTAPKRTFGAHFRAPTSHHHNHPPGRTTAPLNWLLITMRATLRLSAAVKSAKFLTSGAPTGLTGLRTHPSPRPALIYAYSSTLDKLKEFPEHSVYRKSTEALTRQRLSIVESYKPAGYDEWCDRAKAYVEKNKKLFESYRLGQEVVRDGRHFMNIKVPNELVEGEEYFVRQPFLEVMEEADLRPDDIAGIVQAADYEYDPDEVEKLRLEPEPQLSVEQ